ncbi:MAG: hypothetical protein AB2A00_36530, partial [Myxococcota bacterium]
AIHIVVTGAADVDGEILADGEGITGTGGGGAGGSIWLAVGSLDGNGLVSARGGGSQGLAGAGGGGRIAISTTNGNTFSGTLNVDGGTVSSPAANARNGSVGSLVISP